MMTVRCNQLNINLQSLRVPISLPVVILVVSSFIESVQFPEERFAISTLFEHGSKGQEETATTLLLELVPIFSKPRNPVERLHIVLRKTERCHVLLHASGSWLSLSLHSSPDCTAVVLHRPARSAGRLFRICQEGPFRESSLQSATKLEPLACRGARGCSQLRFGGIGAEPAVAMVEAVWSW